MNQIIIENDLVVASVGRKVFAWKAGVGKKGIAAKGEKKRNGGQANRSLRTLGEQYTGTFGAKRLMFDRYAITA